jgi:hypothetical protein
MAQIDSELTEYPVDHVKMHSDEPDLDISKAKDLAKKKAGERCKDPMLLSWYCGKTGEFYPRFECGYREKAPWVVFAEARGGNLTVDINDGEYIFIFLQM